MISSPTLSPLDQRLQLPNRWKIFVIYALTLLMCTVTSPDPNTRGGGQLPNPNECNSTLMSATRGETLIPNPNECNSTLTSGTSGGTAPTYTIYTRGGGQLPNPNECSSILTSGTRGETLAPNLNECNSTLTSGTSTHLYHKKSCEYLSRVQKLNFIDRNLTSIETAVV